MIYRHLSLQSKSSVNAGDFIEKDHALIILDNEKSAKTDGERKHLHLSIRKESSIDLREYVSSQKDLERWIYFEKIAGQ
ncbi:MAG: hypothetical protein U9O20_02805 [Patescibacteria group bacterium]|nr:hypothetical protein [Patescibacteria group bacterium]